ncbi:MAG: hypothetical protein HUU21_20790 [Polyangiaceae bacterium]|nr:hypothetical protein [Polyangiaceae bacterium]
MSSGEASDDHEPAPAPAKKRKKKRKGRPVEGAPDVRSEWPGFAKSFPDHPAVEALVLAFERGNYASVREGAKALLEQSSKPAKKVSKSSEGDELPHPLPLSAEERDALRSAARELIRRTEPDPLAVYMVLGAVVLLAFLSIWYWSHPHVPGP